MGLFSRAKDLGDYKILEVVNENRTSIKTNSARGIECRILFEDENVQYIQCSVDPFCMNMHHYLLRKEKSNKGKVIYLGEIDELACYCDGKIIEVLPYSFYKHCMTMIDCNTGERRKVDYLGKEDVLGVECKYCRDKIINIAATDHDITMLVVRKKTYDSQLAGNPMNEDLRYEIKLVYQNGTLSYMPVNTDSIVKRGPWPKIPLPPGPYTAADMDILYEEYGKEAVDEAILIR